MADKSAVSLFTLRCELDRDDVRDVMAASRLLTILRRSWMVACAVLVALLAELVVLLRLVISRPPRHTAFPRPARLQLVSARPSRLPPPLSSPPPFLYPPPAPPSTP